ncbi:MAG TPA: electron transport complex subunit RsxE [Fibrobacteres bacterium]|nr:electron transport complex subunit RsxE [Fibrobacterota bacterium]
MSRWKIFSRGIYDENPILRLALSLCPALAVTSTTLNALVMGLSVLFVITVNNVTVSLFRKQISEKVRVPIFIISIATIVTVVELVLEAFFPVLFKSLGIYLSLIVVFAIILARAEVFASKNNVILSFWDGLGMGIGFTLAMVLIGAVREILGNGTVFGIRILGGWYNPPMILILAPGGFLVIGCIIGLMNIFQDRMDKAKAAGNSAIAKNRGVS